MTHDERFTSVEICAGAGGQAVGLHWAGFRHLALIEIDDHACDTLRMNVRRASTWGDCEVMQDDLNQLSPDELAGRLEHKLGGESLDLLAGGVPCPPFSAAGKQLGGNDERDLFPGMLRLVERLMPKVVMIENVRGLLEPPQRFLTYREGVTKRLRKAGYEIAGWEVVEACDFGVPQLRPRAILVALKAEYADHFEWPRPQEPRLFTVAEALAPSMRKRFGSSRKGKAAFNRWFEEAQGKIAPTLVGGSKKHGGADLGPTRAKRAWRQLGVDAMGVANDPDNMIDPDRDLYSTDANGQPIGPKLTVAQAAIIQGFPENWKFSGRKTAAYRQVGNAFPPPVAEAIGKKIHAALEAGGARKRKPAEMEEALGERGNAVLFGPIPWQSPSVLRGTESGDRSGDPERAIAG